MWKRVALQEQLIKKLLREREELGREASRYKAECEYWRRRAYRESEQRSGDGEDSGRQSEGPAAARG
ncbi:unnamed protein product [Vitrella brassicaformis CCMP3155]|uniref:Uncharacterized protein n=1 Tax=Vitrella brassicaformis (strain CCMP3155) TaxID=1169540 RepID=A0A0G4FTS9_VITBC|nr:unnamed protein product [Vitrella brassicaformis CCMP3155]|eukprot:CEM18356.1 unnamed protein product [Vitrella brassicaformis CCMP3155]